MFLIIFIYVLLTYFFGFTFGFLVGELSPYLLLVFFWPLILLLFPIGGTLFLVFTCGRKTMLWLATPPDPPPPKREVFYEEVEIIVDDFGPLQFYLLRRQVV